MKDWIGTQHHAVLRGYRLKYRFSELPVRNPGERRRGVESHHYTPETPGAEPSHWKNLTTKQIRDEIMEKLKGANQNHLDTPLGPVDINVSRTPNNLRVTAYRTCPAVTLSPFTSKEPPKKWGQSRAHEALSNRGLHFQRHFSQGRFYVYEYHLDTEKHPGEEHSKIRDTLAMTLADNLPQAARFVVKTQWHPARAAGEDAYQHALVVQVKLSIKPPRPGPSKP